MESEERERGKEWDWSPLDFQNVIAPLRIGLIDIMHCLQPLYMTPESLLGRISSRHLKNQ